MKRSLICVFIFFLSSLSWVFAQKVETVEIYSEGMKKRIKNIVILPDGYDSLAEEKYPVIYLLHGYGGGYESWLNQTKPSLPTEATKRGVIFVCPDGDNSWYWDSPVDPKMKYDTYISYELVSYIDSIYQTIPSPSGRAIAGASMGGHGALWLAINHPDVFGACGSISGCVDIRPFSDNWDMKKWLGNYKSNKARWNQYTVINLLDKIKPEMLIILDCGVDDFFYTVNEDLHKQMMGKKILHDYITRPGNHSHAYWSNAIDYQIQSFSKFFRLN